MTDRQISGFTDVAKGLGFDLRRYPRPSPQHAVSKWWGQRLETRLACRSAIEGANPYARWMLNLLLQSPVTTLETTSHAKAASKPSRRHLIELAARIPQEPTSKTNPVRHLYHDYDFGFEGGANLLLAINLNAGDDVIAAQVNDAVAKARANAGVEPRRKSGHKAPTVAEFNNWYSGKLLQYIDLKLVELLYGKAVKESEFSRLLFPGAVGNTDLLNTAQKQVKKVFNERFVAFLLAN